MSIFEYNARSMGQKIAQRSLVSLLSLALLFATFPVSLSAQDQDAQALPPQDQGAPQDNQAPPRSPLAAFPSVLGNMDKNLSWTSSLGDAYYNQQQDVMDAVQVTRHKAEQTGNL